MRKSDSARQSFSVPFELNDSVLTSNVTNAVLN